MNAATADEQDQASGHPAPSPHLNPQQADAMVRLAEAAPGVRRRYQYFTWTQSQLQTLLPHDILICGAYLRQRRDLVFEAFNSIVLPADLLGMLTDAQGPLLRAVVAAWVAGGGQALVVGGAAMQDARLAAAAAGLRASGIDRLLVHGVARPQRPSEIESLFLLASQHQPGAGRALAQLEMVLPYLHWSWQRVVATERELALAPPPPPRTPPLPLPPSAGPGAAPADAAAAPSRRVTAREREVLQWVREGKSNQQIAALLNISPLTVKNHVQKILWRLGASNRTQAVSEAIALGLLPMAPPR